MLRLASKRVLQQLAASVGRRGGPMCVQAVRQPAAWVLAAPSSSGGGGGRGGLACGVAHRARCLLTFVAPLARPLPQGAPAVAVQAGAAAPALLLAVRGAKTTTGIVGLPLVSGGSTTCARC